jgi:hypothetical protein
VTIEGRRNVASTFYDVTTDAFPWPFTGETVTESPENVVEYVDTAAGSWPEGGAPVPRRRVVAEQKCLRCHDRIEYHGGSRHQVQLCLTCHVPTRTDWSGRPKWAAGTLAAGNVNLGATFDGIEERSTQLKMIVHRIHTGAHEGTASLEAVKPYSGSGTNASYREGMFPGDLANCTTCHEGASYEIPSVPSWAPPTVANETGTIYHQAAIDHPVSDHPSLPAVTAACMACHATGSMQRHLARYPNGEAGESCGPCHLRGTFGVAISHGLAPADASAVGATYSEIAEHILVPRCGGVACHGGNPPTAFPQLDADAGYAAMYRVPSQQASMNLVEPYAPDTSYLVLKIRGDAGRAGGVATPMPIGDAALDPGEIAAIESWIANGARND